MLKRTDKHPPEEATAEMYRYEPSIPKNNWINQYLRNAISEYELFAKIELPNANLDSKFQKIVETEFEYKRKGYYFTMGFIDESCRLCKKCSRPLACDNPLSKPSWKQSRKLQAKYDLKEGQGILLIGPTPQKERKNYDCGGEKIIKVKDEMSKKFNVAVYSLPTGEITATWMTVLQCMFGCRVYSNFSRRWSCAPFCPSPDETRKIIDQYEYALILNRSFSPPFFNRTWLESNIVRDIDQKLWATRCYGKMNKITLQAEKYLLNQSFDVYTFGMSPCHVCAKCTHPRTCRHSEAFRFSADACGIDIYSAAIKAGAKFEIPPKNIVNLFEIILIK